MALFGLRGRKILGKNPEERCECQTTVPPPPNGIPETRDTMVFFDSIGGPGGPVVAQHCGSLPRAPAELSQSSSRAPPGLSQNSPRALPEFSQSSLSAPVQILGRGTAAWLRKKCREI